MTLSLLQTFILIVLVQLVYTLLTCVLKKSKIRDVLYRAIDFLPGSQCKESKSCAASKSLDMIARLVIYALLLNLVYSVSKNLRP